MLESLKICKPSTPWLNVDTCSPRKQGPGSDLLELPGDSTRDAPDVKQVPASPDSAGTRGSHRGPTHLVHIAGRSRKSLLTSLRALSRATRPRSNCAKSESGSGGGSGGSVREVLGMRPGSRWVCHGVAPLPCARRGRAHQNVLTCNACAPCVNTVRSHQERSSPWVCRNTFGKETEV